MQLISRGMGVPVVLVDYGSDGNRLRVSENVDWMVYHSYCKHFHQRLLPAIYQFSEPER